MSPLSPVFLLLAATQANFAKPTTLEMAKAVGEFTRMKVSTDDIRRVKCWRIEEEPTEAKCEWHQKSGGRWQRLSTYVAIDARGWHLIDEPAPIK